MASDKKNEFDVRVDGYPDQVLSMSEIMACYKAYKASGEIENAKAVLEYGTACAYLPAKLELARFLLKTPQIKISQIERYSRAETLYRDVQNTLDLSSKVYAQIAVELAWLCEATNRPVGCLGNLLKAKRYGYEVQEKDIELCRRRLMRKDIYSLGGNSQDALDLGYELSLVGNFKYAEFFLREATEAKHTIVAGQACLYLADLYLEHSAECKNHRQEAQKYYHRSAEELFPEVLCCTEPTPNSKTVHKRKGADYG